MGTARGERWRGEFPGTDKISTDTPPLTTSLIRSRSIPLPLVFFFRPSPFVFKCPPVPPPRPAHSHHISFLPSSSLFSFHHFLPYVSTPTTMYLAAALAAHNVLVPRHIPVAGPSASLPSAATNATFMEGSAIDSDDDLSTPCEYNFLAFHPNRVLWP